MPDRATRRAALIATAVSLPVVLLIAGIAFAVFATRTANPTAASGAPTVGAGATGTVTMPAPKLSPAHAQACLAFIAQLPNKLRNLEQRHVSNGPEQNAAFGDPPITVECGATQVRPAPTDQVLTISGVCWFAQNGQASTVWTTLDREVPVAVTIPNTYAPGGAGSAQWAAEFSAPLVSAMPSIETPYNC